MDWFVILGPVVVLAVVALLGFAGCSFEGGSLPPSLTFKLRVPDALTIVQAGFVFTDPAMVRTPIDAPTASTEPGFNVFTHSLYTPAPGSWEITAATRASATGAPMAAQAVTTVVFPSDGTRWRVDFEASGDPDAGTLRVDFVAFVQV
jgi:hypothetical protein